jgi:hypothetical protein
MKTVETQITKTVGSLLAIALLFTSLLATAQPDYRSEKEPGKGYWKIQTDYDTRSTVIRFFNARNEPIYQETLLGKYVKLTKRNIRLFDETLDRVVNSQLLASQVKSHDLMASSDVRFASTVKNYAPEETSSEMKPEESKTFMVHTLVNPIGKLRVNFVNPNQKLVGIELTDESARTIYYNELNHLAAYNRNFDISHMMTGSYRLQVKGAGQTNEYLLTIDKSNHHYELKPAK